MTGEMGGISDAVVTAGRTRPPPGTRDLRPARPGLDVFAGLAACPRGSTGPQSYVHHCHIVEHEDNEMMRPFTGPP